MNPNTLEKKAVVILDWRQEKFQERVKVAFFSETLKTAVYEGRVRQVVLVDRDGLVVENHGDEYDPEVLASLFSGDKGFIRRIGDELRAGHIDEMAIRVDKRDMRLIVRYVDIQDERFMIIVLLPIREKWRRLTNSVLSSIRRFL